MNIGKKETKIMSDVEWTNEQLQAIEEKDSNILVAAAAGSGKTAVLVERIIHKILNENVNIDELLVVTFTNAAASEMRQRILDAIYEYLDEHPDDKRMQEQIVKMAKANICTIHSFCLDVIRNNFYEIGISPNIRIGNQSEVELLKLQVLEDLFEEKYEQEDKDFLMLIDAYTDYRGDEPLKELLLKIQQSKSLT
jgi:ATP-dependent helicase/nuclease subunit A